MIKKEVSNSRVEELKAQMEKDIAAGRIYHKLPVQYI